MGFHGMQCGPSQVVGGITGFFDEHHRTGDGRERLGLLKLGFEGLKSGFKRGHIPLQRRQFGFEEGDPIPKRGAIFRKTLLHAGLRRRRPVPQQMGETRFLVAGKPLQALGKPPIRELFQGFSDRFQTFKNAQAATAGTDLTGRLGVP